LRDGRFIAIFASLPEEVGAGGAGGPSRRAGAGKFFEVLWEKKRNVTGRIRCRKTTGTGRNKNGLRPLKTTLQWRV
jgi:hypothetical protein